MKAVCEMKQERLAKGRGKTCLAALGITLHIDDKTSSTTDVSILGRLPAHLVGLQQCGQDAVLLQVQQDGVGGALYAGMGVRPLPALPGLLLVLQIRSACCRGNSCLWASK